VQTTSSGTRDTNTAVFTPAVARYVRMVSTAWYENSDRVKLREIEIS